ncbi:hypothetical protein AVEN_128260-1 [Araneus ventricosus]|uniref:Uncharacterized protein n=1 Tax=Araneus ventricosus TaxID=182803 RepID=A0A4Y2MA64_ARAVE|nr:hypothetical protein AVEN_128260-1 [Araneus ventricosus]
MGQETLQATLPLLYPPGKRDPTYLSGGSSSLHLSCLPPLSEAINNCYFTRAPLVHRIVVATPLPTSDVTGRFNFSTNPEQASSARTLSNISRELNFIQYTRIIPAHQLVRVDTVAPHNSPHYELLVRRPSILPGCDLSLEMGPNSLTTITIPSGKREPASL